jgi:hypothetical protein
VNRASTLRHEISPERDTVALGKAPTCRTGGFGGSYGSMKRQS